MLKCGAAIYRIRGWFSNRYVIEGITEMIPVVKIVALIKTFHKAPISNVNYISKCKAKE